MSIRENEIWTPRTEDAKEWTKKHLKRMANKKMKEGKKRHEKAVKKALKKS